MEKIKRAKRNRTHFDKKDSVQPSEAQQAHQVPARDLATTPIRLNSLCRKCRSIDFEDMHSWAYRSLEYLLNNQLDLDATFEQLRASSCPLCRLFGSMMPDGLSSDAATQPCYLRFYLTKEIGLYGHRDVLLIAVHYTPTNSLFDSYEYRRKAGYLSLRQALPHDKRPFGVQRLSRNTFDVEFIRLCLEQCRTCHESKCRTSLTPTRGLRMIHCPSLTIVDAPSACQYVTLSYVWRVSPQLTSIGGLSMQTQSSLDNIPKVIRDAIDVTLFLGFEYLWIDRYCIDQSHSSEKLHQIRQMHSIYAEAQLTIIAAGSSDGLPGVNGTLRNQQPSLKIGEWEIISTLPVSYWTMEKSEWAHRDWTCQEGLLSKRRLVFTDDQGFYACYSNSATEVVSRRAVEFQKTRCPLILDSFPHYYPGEDAQIILDYVREFKRRHLTFPSDSLMP